MSLMRRSLEHNQQKYLVLVGLFMSSDLPPQVFNVTLQGANQAQQLLALLLQLADVGASVIDLSLQTVRLRSQQWQKNRD